MVLHRSDNASAEQANVNLSPPCKIKKDRAGLAWGLCMLEALAG